MTGTHFQTVGGLGSATNGYGPRPSIAHSCTSFSSGSAGTTTPMVILSLPNSIETVTPRARRRGLGKMRLRHRNLRFRLDVEVAKDEGDEEARRTYGAKKG